MKLNFKFPILFMAMAVLTIFSCKDDVIIGDGLTLEEMIEANNTKMVGSWDATTYSQSNCSSDADNFAFVFGDNGLCFELLPGSETCVTANATFMESGMLTIDFITTTTSLLGNTTETESTSGTWEVLDLTRMTVCIDGDCSTGTYTVTNSNLTYNGNDADTGCDISLTANK